MKKPRIPHPTLPGEMLAEEFLVPLGLTQTELAQKIGVAPRSINEICKGKRAISPLMAMRLADVFDNTPEFWMNPTFPRKFMRFHIFRTPKVQIAGQS
jgi:addiction module HigA family antidote